MKAAFKVLTLLTIYYTVDACVFLEQRLFLFIAVCNAQIKKTGLFCALPLLTDMIYNQLIKAFTSAAPNTPVGLCGTGSDVFYL